MTPDQVQILRRLALNDRTAVNDVMSGLVNGGEPLNACTAALVRLAVLLSINSDPATFQSAVEMGIAAGLDDSDVFKMLVIVAPIIGTARLTSSLPHLLAAFDIEILDE